MKLCVPLFIALAAFALTSGVSQAASPEPQPQKNADAKSASAVSTEGANETAPLSLEDCILLALKHSHELRRSGISLERQRVAAHAALYPFDPKLSASYLLSSSRRASGSASTAFSLSRSRSNSFTLSVSKAFPTGDTLGIEQDIVRSGGSSGTLTFPSSYTGNLIYSYSRPLFRNATRAINLAGLEQARNNVALAEAQFGLAEVGVRGAVTQAYWDVVNKARTLKVRDANIDLLKGLLDMNVERYKVGLAVKTDVLQAESALYAQQASAEQASVDVENSKDALKLVIGIEDDISIAEPDTLPSGKEPPSASPDLVERAKSSDPSLQQLLTQLRNAHLTRLVLKNQLRPDVSLQARYSKQGVDTYNPEVLSAMHSPSVSLGLVYNFDVGNRKARGDLATQELSISDLQEQIAAREEQVRNALASTLRQLQQSVATVAAQQKSVDAAKENYDAMKERLLNGLATTLDVVQAEQTLLQAQLVLVSAQISQLTLTRQLATLLGEA